MNSHSPEKQNFEALYSATVYLRIFYERDPRPKDEHVLKMIEKRGMRGFIGRLSGIRIKTRAENIT